ncbi:hypothetical protein AAC387_Pa03g2461 [Persea americana]
MYPIERFLKTLKGSFALRMSLMMAQNAGQAPPITQFFHNTHYRQKSNEWANEVAQQRHEALVQRTEEQSQPSVTTPMTEEQIAVDVLGKRKEDFLNRKVFLSNFAKQSLTICNQPQGHGREMYRVKGQSHQHNLST